MRRFPQSVAAVAAMCALVASPALAGGQKHPARHCTTPPSAVSIYVEQIPTTCGSKATGGPTTTGQSGPSVQPVSVPLSRTAAAKLQRQGGKDRSLLKTVATNPALGVQRVAAAAAPNQRPPSALDLGSGPTTLFVALLAAAALLALGDGLRRRRRQS